MLLVSFVGCIHAPKSVEKKASIYAPVEASLGNINQKVKSHFLISGVPDGFSGEQYKEIVKDVCKTNPVCQSEAEAIYNAYGLSARKIDNMFSVMLCDKEMEWKVMEAFSCNNSVVPIHSWKNKDKTLCEFEKNWKQIERDYCSE